MKKSMLSVMMLCGALLFGCNETDKVDKVETPQVETSSGELPTVVETPQVEQSTEVVETEVEETQRFHLGDTIGNESVQVTFLNAYYTDDRNQFSDKVADKVFILEYEYKNVGLDDEWALFEGTGYVVYDQDGRRLQTYPSIETYYGGTVSKGRMSSSSEAFAVVGDSTHFEIEIGGVIVEFDLE
ncbi:hypothetical protein GMB34_11715 [Turicibacter sanguinis]|nr:hypothetical protein [Turicibacter sanguinis]MTN84860.1 hypothetical protein [Turicibacter sanguinis]MTN87682.1 hypothetical protein [Turicibacter sanguinis]MTN90504.1 hypothetical protein [Turicibacter sanguinis]MTN93426.1 hypothetical protein [Turicibacter sanguinis]